MTSGYGIAHSELSLAEGGQVHGVQLWVALPLQSKDVPPHFEHHANLPTVKVDALEVKLIMGSWLGAEIRNILSALFFCLTPV